MRVLCLLLLLASPLPTLAQNSPKQWKLKIEGDAPNHQALVEKLNLEGTGHRLKFALADLDFEYRVTLITTRLASKPVPAGTELNVASATVFDANGKELFELEQGGSWADAGGASTAAKGIVKNFVKLKIGGAK